MTRDERSTTMNQVDREAILRGVLKILAGMSTDWQMGFTGQTGPATRLGADLAFESLEIVQLVVAIRKYFNRQDLPFRELFLKEDGPVDDLRVSDVVDFLCLHLNNRQAPVIRRP